jgi:serine/threonine-protein kinase
MKLSFTTPRRFDRRTENIMLTEQGGAADVAKVVDFGLVKTRDDAADPGMSAADQIVGTPQFLAPEVILGAEDDSPARDLYALGCVSYYLVTGEHVFAGGSMVQVLAAHLDDSPVPPSDRLGAALPAELELLILELLAKDAADRPESAGAVARRVEQCDCCRAWSQTDARKWWAAHGDAVRARPSDPAQHGATALSIDVAGCIDRCVDEHPATPHRSSR